MSLIWSFMTKLITSKGIVSVVRKIEILTGRIPICQLNQILIKLSICRNIWHFFFIFIEFEKWAHWKYGHISEKNIHIFVFSGSEQILFLITLSISDYKSYTRFYLHFLNYTLVPNSYKNMMMIFHTPYLTYCKKGQYRLL